LDTQQRYRIRFFTTADLLLQLGVSSSQNRLEQYLSKVIAASRLLIIDEFGYVKLNEAQANSFFQLINVMKLVQ
jgi:DNA replication protein DnaC